MKLAFVDAEFPGSTSTFVNREFEYLKKCTDIDVVAVAIKRPPLETLNQEYKEYVQNTLYLRPDALGATLLYNLLALCTQPATYWRSLRILTGELKNQCPYRAARIIFHLMCGVYLGYYLQRQRFDAIHAHFSAASTIALFAHLFSGIPFSFTLHASADLYAYPVLLEPKLHYARHVITNNRYNEMHINLLTYYRYRDKISIIYNGVDLERFQPAQQKAQATRPVRLLSVGSFTGCKGYPTVLAALWLLKQEGLEFIYTVIGGGYRAEQEMIERLIADYQLEETVILLGRQSFTRVYREMQLADIVVMASEIGNLGVRDGFPNVMIEAMLAKRPVVTTYISDIPNIIKAGETGYLFPEKNSVALAAILRQLYHGYESTLLVVERAFQLARGTFDREKNYQLLTQLLADLAKPHTGVNY